MALAAYCLDWHVTKSDAFRDMLVDPLKPYVDIKLVAWNGENLPNNPKAAGPLIFCMLPPSEEILKNYKQKIVWLPMWDQAQDYDQTWWDKLPKNVHIVSFSDRITAKATAAGLPTLKLKYFKDPTKYRPVSWNNGKVIFYWNRTGLVGPSFLENLCQSVSARELLFLGQIDPRIDKTLQYSLPSKFGQTKVTNLKLTGRDEFLSAVSRANIFVAPRKAEGVGMTFLEAMCKGCSVIGYDAPTMNEYIQHDRNGLLIRNNYPRFIDRLTNKNLVDRPSGEPFYVKADQPWQKIAKHNFQKLGDKARQDHVIGHRNWVAQTEDYAHFVVGT